MVKDSLKPGRAGELAQIVFSNTDVGRALEMGFRRGPHKPGERWDFTPKLKKGKHGAFKENGVL